MPMVGRSSLLEVMLNEQISGASGRVWGALGAREPLFGKYDQNGLFLTLQGAGSRSADAAQNAGGILGLSSTAAHSELPSQQAGTHPGSQSL